MLRMEFVWTKWGYLARNCGQVGLDDAVITITATFLLTCFIFEQPADLADPLASLADSPKLAAYHDAMGGIEVEAVLLAERLDPEEETILIQDWLALCEKGERLSAPPEDE